MATLTVWKFEDAEGAQAALSIAEDLQKKKLINVLDGALVSWPAGAKKPKTKHLHHMAGPEALAVTFWGMLWDLLFFYVPLVGDEFGRVAAAFSGSLADIGIEDAFIDSVRDKVRPGTSALFAVTSDAVFDKVRTAMADSGLHPELIRSDLSEAQEKALRDAFR